MFVVCEAQWRARSQHFNWVAAGGLQVSVALADAVCIYISFCDFYIVANTCPTPTGTLNDATRRFQLFLRSRCCSTKRCKTISEMYVNVSAIEFGCLDWRSSAGFRGVAVGPSIVYVHDCMWLTLCVLCIVYCSYLSSMCVHWGRRPGGGRIVLAWFIERSCALVSMYGVVLSHAFHLLKTSPSHCVYASGHNLHSGSGHVRYVVGWPRQRVEYASLRSLDSPQHDSGLEATLIPWMRGILPDCGAFCWFVNLQSPRGYVVVSPLGAGTMPGIIMIAPFVLLVCQLGRATAQPIQTWSICSRPCRGNISIIPRHRAILSCGVFEIVQVWRWTVVFGEASFCTNCTRWRVNTCDCTSVRALISSKVFIICSSCFCCW